MPPARSLPPTPAKPPTSRLISVTGRLHNEHFHLRADHLMLELAKEGHELIAAIAEGSVEVHLIREDLGLEYIYSARRAVFRPETGRLHLGEWLGTRVNGEYEVFESPHPELVLPADGSFFHQAEVARKKPASAPSRQAVEWRTAALVFRIH